MCDVCICENLTIGRFHSRTATGSLSLIIQELLSEGKFIRVVKEGGSESVWQIKKQEIKDEN